MHGQQRVVMGPQLTPFTKQVLTVLAGLYVAQLLLENWIGVPMLRTFAWWSIESPSFAPWQPLTAFFVNNPGEPIWVVVQWVVLAFFIPPAESALGRRGLFEAITWAAVGGISITLALNTLGAVGGPTPYLGVSALLEALIVIFGLYVQFHGDFGPGGGFQAGVIIAVAVILIMFAAMAVTMAIIYHRACGLWGGCVRAHLPVPLLLLLHLLRPRRRLRRLSRQPHLLIL